MSNVATYYDVRQSWKDLYKSAKKVLKPFAEEKFDEQKPGFLKSTYYEHVSVKRKHKSQTIQFNGIEVKYRDRHGITRIKCSGQRISPTPVMVHIASEFIDSVKDVPQYSRPFEYDTLDQLLQTYEETVIDFADTADIHEIFPALRSGTGWLVRCMFNSQLYQTESCKHEVDVFQTISPHPFLKRLFQYSDYKKMADTEDVVIILPKRARGRKEDFAFIFGNEPVDPGIFAYPIPADKGDEVLFTSQFKYHEESGLFNPPVGERVRLIEGLTVEREQGRQNTVDLFEPDEEKVKIELLENEFGTVLDELPEWVENCNPTLRDEDGNVMLGSDVSQYYSDMEAYFELDQFFEEQPIDERETVLKSLLRRYLEDSLSQREVSEDPEDIIDEMKSERLEELEPYAGENDRYKIQADAAESVARPAFEREAIGGKTGYDPRISKIAIPKQTGVQVKTRSGWGIETEFAPGVYTFEELNRP